MRCAVLGDPIEHSLSPVPCTGRRTPRSGWTGPTTRCGSRPAGWRRSSAPGRRLARAVADHAAQARGDRRCSPHATPGRGLAGAANTLLLDRGRRHGLNTDVPGAHRRDARGDHRRPVGSAVVLGGGRDVGVGAARPRRAGLAAADARRARPGPRHGDPRGRRADTRGRRTLDRAASTTCRPVGADVVVSTVPAEAQTAVACSTALARRAGRVRRASTTPGRPRWPRPRPSRAARGRRARPAAVAGGRPGAGDDRSLRRPRGGDARSR